MIAVHRHLEETPALAGPTRPLRIVGLHHHVQPMTMSEEVKGFADMVNGGEFLNWIVNNRVDVVLHGHKHEGAILSAGMYSLTNAGTTRRVLIVSAPALEAGHTSRAPVGRLIRIEGSAPLWAGVDVATVRPAGPGEAFTPSWEHFDLTDPATDGLIDGQDVSEVHDHLIAAGQRIQLSPAPLVCRVRDGSSALTYPRNYEFPAEVTDKQAWFEGIVNWWQRTGTVAAQRFTHGQRLYAYGVGHIDQINRIGEELIANMRTSRAVATLIDPEADSRDSRNKPLEFPSFALVQFVRRDEYLDVIAYFRKQEMPHWWPVNVAELASMQSRLLDRLKPHVQISAGSITTVTAIPINGQGIPRVAIPEMDRLVDKASDVFEIVVPLIGPAAGDVVARWHDLFGDWRPSESVPADGDRFPRVGLTALREAVEIVALADPLPNRRKLLDELASEIEFIDTRNSSFDGEDKDAQTRARPRWRQKVDGSIDKVLSLVKEIAALSAAGVETEPS